MIFETLQPLEGSFGTLGPGARHGERFSCDLFGDGCCIGNPHEQSTGLGLLESSLWLLFFLLAMPDAMVSGFVANIGSLVSHSMAARRSREIGTSSLCQLSREENGYPRAVVLHQPVAVVLAGAAAAAAEIS